MATVIGISCSFAMKASTDALKAPEKGPVRFAAWGHENGINTKSKEGDAARF